MRVIVSMQRHSFAADGSEVEEFGYLARVIDAIGPSRCE